MHGRYSFLVPERVLFWAASIAGAAIIRGLSSTWRVRLMRAPGAERVSLGYADPLIYVTWHRRMFGFFDLFGKRHVGVMISLSKDGEIVSRAAEHLGFRPIRGSSTRGAVGGMLGVLRRLRAGRPVGFLADGPKGPAGTAKPGAVYASRDRGSAIVPLAYSARDAWVLRSWDRYIVPKPFTSIVIVVGKPFAVNPGASEEEVEANRARLERELDSVCRQADEVFGQERRAQGGDSRAAAEKPSR